MFVRRKQTFWLALLSAGILYGQAELATVTGIVADSAKAVIPGVKVTVRNVDTGIAHTVATNQEGYFTIPELPAGPYVLEAASPGFEIYRETGITLETGQTLRVPVTMKVGSVTESVEVTADVAPLNTENGMVKGYVVVQAEIADMPLNGRDFTELALYVPGVVATSAGQGGSFASINGVRSDATNFLVDGVDDRNARGAAAQLRPNIDAMQEFKMETSGYSAEYGKMAGGILNMVLKSGSNSYHGTAFEYLRNDFFDAKAYFDTSRLPFHQNQFGGLISGPVSIPKLYNGKDRTFFMFSWESLQNHYGESYLGTVPTAAEHDGNFAGIKNNTGAAITLKNPLSTPTYAPFPGNIIPASMISPIAQKIIQYYPLPNRTALGNNYIDAARRYSNFNSFISRGDHRFDDKNNITITYGKRFAWSNQPTEESNLGLFDAPIRDDRELGGINYTHVFSPSLILESRFGLSRNATRDSLTGNYPTAAQLGMVGSTPGLPDFPAAFPTINVTGYLAIGYSNNEPVQYFVTNFGVHETLTWIKGAHILKMGTDLSRNRFNQPYYNNARGTMTASGIWSGDRTATNGDGIADLELGLLASSTIDLTTARNYMRNRQSAFFFSDDWKTTRNLTLNLGLRYEIDGPPSDLYGRMTNFIPALGEVLVSNPANIANYAQSLASTTRNLYVSADSVGAPQALIYTNHKGIAPRVGFAWRVLGNNSTVIRGGYGIFYTGATLNNVRNGLDNVFPVVTAPSFSNVAANPNALTLASPWPGGLATLGSTQTGYPFHPPNAYIQSYNFTLERQLNRWMVLEAAFVGSKGTHLSTEFNLNTPYRTMAYYQATGTFPSPFPAFGTINEWCLCTNSIYNSGQFTFRNRSNGGLTYHVSYVYSKSLDEASEGDSSSATLGGTIEDPRNLGLSRARSDFDHRHVVQAVVTYPLPVGRGKRFLASTDRFVNGVIGGWLLAGTAIVQTGPPMTIEDSSINAAIGQNAYPNRIANGADTTGNGRRGVDYPWYNPADFIPVPGCASRTNCAPDQYGFLPFNDGNSGRNILDAPGLANINASLQKNWVTGERKSIQFRGEVFNIFNHPNFVLMDRNFNETAAGYLTSVAATGTGGARIMQFAVKYLF
ncbi:MAG TPA: carboxypeptidase regulatory-like domain-containing protein [Bryobacteraceae bacterium]|jgi:hypothetical protein